MARLKRMVIPGFWNVARKANKWVVAPRPGPHKKLESVPLQVLLRDTLGILDMGKDARTVIKRGEILVDGRKRKDHAYPVGLFDVLSIPASGKNYRAVPTAKTLGFIEISEKESKVKPCKIVGKTVVEKGKMQVNLHDGRNVLVDSKDYKTGDTLIIGLPENKIVEHISLEVGAMGVVTKGADVGKVGRVKRILQASNKDHAKVICDFDGKEEEVLKDRFFVIGKTKPVIKISD